jgi:hypothetical protein
MRDTSLFGGTARLSEFWELRRAKDYRSGGRYGPYQFGVSPCNFDDHRDRPFRALLILRRFRTDSNQFPGALERGLGLAGTVPPGRTLIVREGISEARDGFPPHIPPMKVTGTIG